MSGPLAQLGRLVSRHPGPVAVLLALTMVRLLTNGGLSGSVATEVYLLAVTALVVTWCLRVLVRAESMIPRPWQRSRRVGEPQRPERLKRFEDKMEWWAASPHARHRGLRPAVRALTADRFRRAGIDIDRDPRARQLLGPSVWALIERDVPEPLEDGPGLTLGQAQDLARTLKTLGSPDLGLPAPTATAGEQH